MKVLVIGQGGREHALVRALRQSASVTEVHAIPGSDGMSAEATCHPNLDWRNFSAITQFMRSEKMDFVVVGPEAPLAMGIADQLRETGVPVFGPNHEAAQLEASKVFSKRFMVDAGVPTSRFFDVFSVQETMIEAENFAPPFVLKADGLAAGKGVYICKDSKELRAAATAIFDEKVLGEAGSKALLEEFQPGYEISYLILTNGEGYEPLLLAQDNKRLRDGDQGPNTGGMGTVAPMKIDAKLDAQIRETVFEPVMHEFKKRHMMFRGVLFVGLMITPMGPQVLEFNVRFGDPETQVILPLLDGDWGQVLLSVAQGKLPKLKWKSQAAACVVMAAEGYPESPKNGVAIDGDLTANTENSYFLHAGTKRGPNGNFVTAGGRVLNAVGIGANLQEALDRAYAQTRKASWPGMQIRTDVGKKLV
jgi:phosphoribosylamine---glycine ligase